MCRSGLGDREALSEEGTVSRGGRVGVSPPYLGEEHSAGWGRRLPRPRGKDQLVCISRRWFGRRGASRELWGPPVGAPLQGKDRCVCGRAFTQCTMSSQHCVPTIFKHAAKLKDFTVKPHNHC